MVPRRKVGNLLAPGGAVDGVRATGASLRDGVHHAGPAVVEAALSSASASGMGPDPAPDTMTAPGTMTFAFGSRANYLYWPLPDGRIAWAANVPSKEYLSTTQAAARPPEHWLQVLRALYAGDHPGQALAAATTAKNLEVLGGSALDRSSDSRSTGQQRCNIR